MDRRRNQPPLVDTTRCLCRVDANLKDGTAARKVVPGSKFCIQSSVKPSIHPTKQKVPRHGRSQRQSPLISGLPDDLAIACLIRVPRTEHRKLRLVCKRWKCLLASNYFYSVRRNNGMSEEWIYIVKRDKDGRISLDAFDPLSLSWQSLPAVPREYTEALGFGCAVLSGCHLYFFGGQDPVRGSMRRVIIYNARNNKWHRAPDMLRRRHLFGYSVLNNCLYVAGGEGEGERYLRTVEMYDPRKNRWFFVSEMNTAMVPLCSVVYDGRWYLKGLGAHGEVLSEVYDPLSDSWQQVFNGMVAGWKNPTVYINGKLYSTDCKDGCRLRVYDATTDSWSKHMDSKMHMGGSPALEAACLAPLGGKLCVVRNNMSITLVSVSRSEGSENGDEVWETISGKGHVKTFFVNLWSNIAGRNHMRHKIIHCHVLQA